MSILAQLQQQRDGANRRGSPRRRLLLEAAGPADTRVLIHDMSQTGFLIEASATLPIGAFFEVQLPEAGSALAEIVWSSGQFFGCRFAKPIAKAAVSAALLRSPTNVGDEERVSSRAPDIALELQAISARLEQLTKIVEDDIQENLRERQWARAEHTQLWDSAALSLPRIPDADIADEERADDRLSFGTRLRVILLLALGSWAAILWAFGIF
jgi:PilZ domain-containing protein